MNNTQSDALVFFSATGDLAYKQVSGYLKRQCALRRRRALHRK
jgi:hypothetical protein